eukprot:6440109-Prymnesium_polylepis.1
MSLLAPSSRPKHLVIAKIAQDKPPAEIRSGPHTVSLRLVKTRTARSTPSTSNCTRQAPGECPCPVRPVSRPYAVLSSG